MALANCLNQFYRLMSKVFYSSWKGFFQKIAHKIKKKITDQKLLKNIKICVFKLLHWRPTTCLVDTISHTVNGRWIPTKEKKWKMGASCPPRWPPVGVTRETDDRMILKMQPSYWEVREDWEVRSVPTLTEHLPWAACWAQGPTQETQQNSSEHKDCSQTAWPVILPLPLICCETLDRLLNLSGPQLPHL